MTASEAFEIMAARAQQVVNALDHEAGCHEYERAALEDVIDLVAQDVAFAKHMAAAMREVER